MQNIQGIHDDHHLTDARIIKDAANRLDISILGLIETNLNWNKGNLQQRIKTAFNPRSHHRQSSMNPTDTEQSTYLPGGTATIVNEPWTSKTSSTTDPTGMGRWSEISLQGRNHKSITIITAYRVCINNSGTHDDNTAFSQQWKHLLSTNNTSPDPRKEIFNDLTNRITALRERKSEVIILIDANEHMYQRSKGRLPKWVQDNQLIDIHALRHDSADEPETQKRGTHRIDFIFISPPLIPFITASGILPYNTLGKGDHRP